MIQKWHLHSCLPCYKTIFIFADLKRKSQGRNANTYINKAFRTLMIILIHVLEVLRHIEVKATVSRTRLLGLVPSSIPGFSDLVIC